MSARLLLVASLNFADDYGGLDRSAKQLKAQAFPYDQIDCEPLIQELIRVGLLIQYEVNNRMYLHIKGFQKHQKVEKPAKPRIPVYDPSVNTPLLLPESSPSPHLLVAVSSSEGNGREGKGKEGEGEREGEPPPAGLDLAIWGKWLEYRSKIRKPLKPASIPAAQRALAAFGSDQAAVVEQSIAQGWQGLFALKLNGAQPVSTPPLKLRTADEIEAEELARAGH